MLQLFDGPRAATHRLGGLRHREVPDESQVEHFALVLRQEAEERLEPGEARRIQDYVFGDGFEADPTEIKYKAGSLAGTLTLDAIGAECEDSEPGDCEVTSGSFEASMLLWDISFPPNAD